MAWVVLQLSYNPNLFRLQSEREWLAMDRHWRFGWTIVKRCESRDEPNRVFDEVRAAAKKASE